MKFQYNFEIYVLSLRLKNGQRIGKDLKHLEYLGLSWYDLNIICILIFKSFSLTDTDDTSLLGKKDDGLQYRPDVKGTE